MSIRLPCDTRERRPCLAVAAIIAASLLAYAGTCWYGFFSDDVALVDRLLRGGFAGVTEFLNPATGATGAGGYQAYYRPVWVLTTYVDWLIWGLNPVGYHLTNLLIFVACGVLVWRLVVQVTDNYRIALWSGLIFAVHPIHTLNVIWISGRTDSLATLGVLAALVAFIEWRETEYRGWLVGALAAGLFALGSKEMAYMLPLLAVATEWTRLSIRDDDSPARRALRASLPFWFLAMLWGSLILANSSFASGFYVGFSPMHVALNWAGAVALLVLPAGYEGLVGFATTNAALAAGLGGLGLIAGGLVLWKAWERPALRWGILWVAVGILPLYRVTMRWYTFLASVGIAIGCGSLVNLLSERIEWREHRFLRHAGQVVGAVLVFLFVLGLAGERMKWARAEAVRTRVLDSLITLATDDPAPGRVVFLGSPAKMDRMPVFGGNAESFLRIGLATRGITPDRCPELVVPATVVMDEPDASIIPVWITPAELRISSEQCAFHVMGDYFIAARRRRLESGDAWRTEGGRLVIRSEDHARRPDAVTVLLDHPPSAGERWGNLLGGSVVAMEVPTLEPTDTREALNP